MTGDAMARLGLAIEQAQDSGLKVPCIGRDEWLLEDAESTAYARQRCQVCPVLQACAAAAEAVPPVGVVWAGFSWSYRGRPITQPAKERPR